MERHRGTIALALLIIGLFGWLKADISGLRNEMRAEIRGLSQRMCALDERVARIECALFRGPLTAAELRSAE